MVRSLTLADVRERVSRDDSLSSRRRSELRSALKRIGEFLGVSLHSLPADVAQLRGPISRLHHAQHGISKKHLSKMRGRLLDALELSGVPVLRDRRGPRSPAWQNLIDELPQSTPLGHVTRFISYCDAHGIAPKDVNDEVSQDFKRVLDKCGMARDPEYRHRLACRRWNLLARTVPSWPKTILTISERHDAKLRHRWMALPAEFRDDVDQFLAWLRGEDNSRPPPERTVKHETIERYSSNIRALVWALEARGFDLASLTSLADLVSVDAVKEAMRHVFDKRRGRFTQQDRVLAGVAYRIARDWVRADENHLQQLWELKRQLGLHDRELGPKGQEALRQFYSERNLSLILNLPDRLMSEARNRGHVNRRGGNLAQMAVAIEFLSVAPMRFGQLARLRIDRHIKRIGRYTEQTYLSFPKSGAQDSVELKFALPGRTVDLMDEYLTQFRPHLTDDSNPWLFPGQSGKFKCPRWLRHQLTTAIHRYTGLRMSPQAFRPLAAKLVLDAEPGAYELVRQLLGHAHLNYTLDFFKGLQVDRGMESYDRLLSNRTDSGTLDGVGIGND